MCVRQGSRESDDSFVGASSLWDESLDTFWRYFASDALGTRVFFW